MSPLDVTNVSFVMGFIVFVSSCRDTASQYSEGRNISVTWLRYSANHSALDSWPIKARLASQNDELCKNRCFSERRSIEEYTTIMYHMWKIICFFTLNHINTLYYTKYTKQCSFLATAYDPFNACFAELWSQVTWLETWLGLKSQIWGLATWLKTLTTMTRDLTWTWALWLFFVFQKNKTEFCSI